MPVSRAKRASNNRWDAQNMKIVSTKVRREAAEAFSAACAERNTTPSAVLRAAIERFMAETGTEKGAKNERNL